MTSELCLFVGGLADGRWIEVDDFINHHQVVGPVLGTVPRSGPDMRSDWYTRHRWEVGGGVFSIFAERSIQPALIFAALLQNYRAARPMDKLRRLLSLCKCGVFVTVNDHRDYYETAERHLEEAKSLDCPPQIADDVRDRMVELDAIVKIQFYPDTPIGSYTIWHHDLDAALEEALACLPEGGQS